VATTKDSSESSGPAAAQPRDRRLLIRYAVLTLALFIPLLAAFAFVRNLYPFAASTMMVAGGDLQSGRTYYWLRGETTSGEIIDLPAMELTDALSGRTWPLVNATVQNSAFKISSPHPANVALISAAGGIDRLPPAARLNDLLRAWGMIYNSRLSPSSPQRLRAVRLDQLRWEGGSYGNYDRLVQSWRVEL
jgi:hypothetical protein